MALSIDIRTLQNLIDRNTGFICHTEQQSDDMREALALLGYMWNYDESIGEKPTPMSAYDPFVKYPTLAQVVFLVGFPREKSNPMLCQVIIDGPRNESRWNGVRFIDVKELYSSIDREEESISSGEDAPLLFDMLMT